MLKTTIALLGSLGLLLSVSTTNVLAGAMHGGISGMIGFVETDGHELEGSASEKTTESEGESFAGASFYAEYEFDNGLGFGAEIFPVDADLGSGKRTDTQDDESTGDTGARSASASMEDLYSIYAIWTLENGYFAKLGHMEADITTTETLPNSSYGNVSVDGLMYEIGYKASDNVRFAASYVDFDSINITSSDGVNKISADADAYMFKVSLGF